MMQRWPEKCYPRGKKDETQSSRDRHPKELRAFVDSLSKKQLQEIREEFLDRFADGYLVNRSDGWTKLKEDALWN